MFVFTLEQCYYLKKHTTHWTTTLRTVLRLRKPSDLKERIRVKTKTHSHWWRQTYLIFIVHPNTFPPKKVANELSLVAFQSCFFFYCFGVLTSVLFTPSGLLAVFGWIVEWIRWYICLILHLCCTHTSTTTTHTYYTRMALWCDRPSIWFSFALMCAFASLLTKIHRRRHFIHRRTEYASRTRRPSRTPPITTADWHFNVMLKLKVNHTQEKRNDRPSARERDGNTPLRNIYVVHLNECFVYYDFCYWPYLRLSDKRRQQWFP